MINCDSSSSDFYYTGFRQAVLTAPDPMKVFQLVSMIFLVSSTRIMAVEFRLTLKVGVTSHLLCSAFHGQGQEAGSKIPIK